MTEIKIGRRTYDIKKGDYIQYNGACYLFCSGDGRTLKQEGFNAYRHLNIPKTVIKKINLFEMKKIKVVTQFTDVQVTRFLF